MFKEGLAESLPASPALFLLGSRAKLGRHENVVDFRWALCMSPSCRHLSRKGSVGGLTVREGEGHICGPKCCRQGEVIDRRSHLGVGGW